MSQPSQTLADRWTLVEKIDEGAMGEIYRATHAVLGHTVAVKVLNPTVSRDKAAIERFLREARIAARLQHKNVVRVEDFGVAEDGRPFLVMELLRGESLARRLARAPRVTHGEALDIVRQIAAALDTAHGAGIIHRDLKPENIFLAEAEAGATVKVLDFGVAKFTDVLANGARATASNTLIGTPRYMSPEQARSSRELDGRSDLWALGMIAYEMLTGAHPFEGEAIAELLVAILTHRIPTPSSLRPELPAALDTWASIALARSRYERFPTGRVLADALADALDGRLDERWSGEPGPLELPRATTLRVPRPAVDGPASSPPSSDPRKHTPLEGPAPVTVPVRYDERTPPRGVGTSPETLVVPPSPRRARASWMAAALVAALAAISLVVAVRALDPRSAPRATLALLATPTPTPAAPATPPPERPLAEPPAQVTTPPEAPSVAESPPLRRHRRHGRRQRVETTGPAAASSAPGLYDPPGI